MEATSGKTETEKMKGRETIRWQLCQIFSVLTLTSSPLFRRIKYFSLVIRENQRFCNIWFRRNWITITDITLHTLHSCLFLRKARCTSSVSAILSISTMTSKKIRKKDVTLTFLHFLQYRQPKQISLLPKRKKSRTAKARFHKGESNYTLSWVCWTKFFKIDSIGITTVCIGQSVSEENKLLCSRIASKAS